MHFLLLIVFLGWSVSLSLIVFCLLGWDKRQAQLGRRRVPERILLSLAGLGGWPGAFIGIRQFRHKTQKQPFRLWLALATVWHVGFAAVLVWLLAFRDF